jgi:DNA-binding XRE family transcriptional regulator
MDVVLVKNANRMMTTASLLDDGIELSFADGFKGLIPYADVPEVREREGICGLELPNPYEMVLEMAGGERVEVPWDFARHYCDASYRPTIEVIAAMGRQTLGERVRRFRESAGLTQVALAQAADIGRVTLVRLENGEQSPRFKTLQAIARALKMDTRELLIEPELLSR